MDLIQIRYFLSLARTLNFTRAAEACNVTQPALTRSIQRLEDELGGPLLLRERSLTQLTELGRTMLPLLEQTWTAAETARAAAAGFRRRETMPLRVGLGPGAPFVLLAPVAQELERRFRGLELNLSRATGAGLNEALLHGEIDVVFTADPAMLTERANRWTLYADRVAVMLPSAHPLAERDEVPAAALDSCDLVSLTDDTEILSRTLDLLRTERGLALRVRHRGSSEDTVQQLVLAGVGVALTTERRQPRLPGLVSRPLADPTLEHDAVVAVLAGRPLGPATDALVRLCRVRDWVHAGATHFG